MASAYQKWVINGSEMSPDYHGWIRNGSEMGPDYQKWISIIRNGFKSSEMDLDYQKWIQIEMIQNKGCRNQDFFTKTKQEQN